VLTDDGRARWTPARDDHPPLRGLTCGALLDEAAAQWPDRDALVYCAYDDEGPSARWSFDELRRRAREVARALLGCGARPGDRVAVWATNVPEWLLAQFGCAYAGMVLVPLNPLYRTSEVAHVLRTAEASVLLVEPSNRGVSLWDMALEAAAELPALQRLVAIGDAPDGQGASWRELVAAGASVDDARLDAIAVDAADIAQIQFTSGTTGAPKGAMLRHGALTDNARLFGHRAEWASGWRVCSGMPQFHCGGSVLATMGAFAIGATLLPLVTFDPRRAIDTVDTELVEVLCAVPTMLLAIEDELERAGGSLRSVERIVTGGSLVPPEIARRWHQRLGVTFSITYGLTETSPVITQSSPSDPIELQVGTVGRALPHVECDVADVLTGAPAAVGEEGEVRARGWQVMAGYYGDPGATAETITPEGWLRTGDLGRLDADGYLRITGRAKEMIIRGGENLYPAEIEAALRTVPGVVDAYVVGVPDDRYGEAPAAFVRLADGASLDVAAMRRALEGRIARFKIPAHLRVVDAYPLTASGKVQKFRLREQFLSASVAGA
jgi:acyl-CoA synthetase (AMP-forming)/AMP-acid ligase II